LRRIDSGEVDSTVKAVQARKVRQLYAMLDGTSCRAAAVRRYFGEAAVDACGQCDFCLNPPEATDARLCAARVADSGAARSSTTCWVRPRKPRPPEMKLQCEDHNDGRPLTGKLTPATLTSRMQGHLAQGGSISMQCVPAASIVLLVGVAEHA
jgi:hypothetical protein